MLLLFLSRYTFLLGNSVDLINHLPAELEFSSKEQLFSAISFDKFTELILVNCRVFNLPSLSISWFRLFMVSSWLSISFRYFKFCYFFFVSSFISSPSLSLNCLFFRSSDSTKEVVWPYIKRFTGESHIKIQIFNSNILNLNDHYSADIMD